MQAAQRAIFNTGITYAKTIITILISLFSTRLVINALGVEDYGLFNVIGGLISMLAFLNAAMTVSTQRYISFNIGTGNIESTKKIFANSVILHFIIALVVVSIIEIVGLYFLNYKLKIDPSRIGDANVVFQMVAASMFIVIVSVPYDAVTNAHENMSFLALISIIDSLLKLVTALSLSYTDGNRLLIYGALTLLTTIIIRLIKRVYVSRKYRESKVNYKTQYDKATIKSLTSFASWNLVGSISYMGRNQGLSILLNIFFGTVINAAFGIANQVASQMMFFSGAMPQALNPQIMKSEGAMNREHMLKLAMVSCKFSFLLLAFIAIPCIIEMPTILQLWLKVVPDYTTMFCSYILVGMMINQLTGGLDSAIQATGKIKNYMLLVGSTKLLILPISYFLLSNSLSLTYVFIVYVLLEITGSLIRIYILKKQVNLRVYDFTNAVIKPVTPVIIITLLADLLLTYIFNFELRWLLTITFSVSLFLALSYTTSLTEIEKKTFNKLISNSRKKLITATNLFSYRKLLLSKKLNSAD